LGLLRINKKRNRSDFIETFEILNGVYAVNGEFGELNSTSVERYYSPCTVYQIFCGRYSAVLLSLDALSLSLSLSLSHAVLLQFSAGTASKRSSEKEATAS